MSSLATGLDMTAILQAGMIVSSVPKV